MLKKTIIIISLLSFFILIPSLVLAEEEKGEDKTIKYKMQVGIPGTDFAKDKEVTISGDSTSKYIKIVYGYATAIVGILATVVLMFGGIIWMTSGGNAERAGNAKAWIGAALSGLVLVLSSYLILSYVNPGLVSFQPISLQKIKSDPSYTFNEECVMQVSESGCHPGFTLDDPSKCTTGQSFGNCCCKDVIVGAPE